MYYNISIAARLLKRINEHAKKRKKVLNKSKGFPEKICEHILMILGYNINPVHYEYNTIQI